MHTASYIYLFLMLYIFISRRKMKNIFVELVVLYSFTYISVEAGSFVDAFGIRISYAMFVQLFVLLFAVIIIIYYILKKWLLIPDLKRIGVSLLCVIIGIINLVWHPANVLVVNGETLPDQVWIGKVALRFPSFSAMTVSTFSAYTLFFIILYAIFLTFNFDDYQYAINAFARYSKILVVTGYVEFIIKLLISNQLYSDFMISFWGTNSRIEYSEQLRNGLPMLYGWTQEPSHYAYTLFVIMVVMLARSVEGKKQAKWIIAAGLLLVLTMAFSALLFAVTYIAILYVYRNKGTKSYLKRMFGIVVIAVLIVAGIWWIISTGAFEGSFFGDRLSNILKELPVLLRLDIWNASLAYNSYRVRLVSSFSTLKLIVHRPLLGFGIGSLSSHGSSATILSSIGMIGTYTWLKAMFGGRIREFVDIDMTAYTIIIIFWLVMGIFMSHFLGMLYGGENYILIPAYAIICENLVKEKKEIGE